MYNAGKYVYGEILPIKYIYGTLDNNKKEKVIFKSYLQINCDLVGTLVTVTNGLRTYRGSIDSSGYCIIEIEKSGNYFIIGKYDEYESIPAKMAIVENKHLYEFDLEIELPEPEPDMNYLTFTSDSEFTLATANNAINWDGILQYSFDKITWSVWDGTEISSSTGNVIYLRGSNNTFITGSSSDAKRWVLTGENIFCSGNIETILDYKTVLNEEHPVMGSNCYNKLFKDCTALITPPELPAITLANYCYSNMFFGCTSLTSAPTLSADTLTRNCYAYMFHGCTSLTEAPELPATTIANFCYNYMFYGCESLTTAPELPATTLAVRCYDNMFRNCTSLTTAPELPATVLSNYCYTSMFSGCTSLTAAPELPATTLAESCYDNMFSGCTALTSVPELPATTLATSCYRYMFNGCTSLTTLPELPATELVTRCYNSMFYGCSSIKLSSTKTLEYTIPYRIPSEGQGTTATDALSNMFVGTGGTFKNTPVINTTYYLWNPVDTNFLTFSSDEPFTLGVNNGLHNDGTLEYSTDAITWTTWNGSTLSSNADNELYLRGINNTSFKDVDTYDYTTFKLSPSSTNAIQCTGNIETLLDYRTVELNEHPIMSSYCFSRLFYDCSHLSTAPELPATTLASSCYSAMFSDCTSLITPPQLPATTLSEGCYQEMFRRCTSLTVASELPATTLASACYSNMFHSCTSIVEAPELPATTLANYCYSNMFNGCTSLTTAPELPALTVLSACYESMFSGCTALIEAPNLPATTLLGDYCYQFMFSECTSLTTAPSVLPATTLGLRYYEGMFEGCTSLTTAPNILATTLGSYCCTNMFKNCTSLVTAPSVLPALTLTISCYEYMFRGCTSLTTPPSLPATTAAVACYAGMFEGCTSLTSAPALPVTTLRLKERCYAAMFANCTSLVTAPELPATEISGSCYFYMFGNCTSLLVPPQLPATTLFNNCYEEMFNGCTSIKLSETQTAEYNLPYRIPTEGTGSVTINSLNNMFTDTGGTFTGTPTINTTYYLWNPVPDFSAQPIVRTGYTDVYAITWTSTNGTPMYAYYQEMPTSEGSTTILQTYRTAVSLYNMYAFLGSSWICYVSEDNNGGNGFNIFRAVTIGSGEGGPNYYLNSYDSKNRLYYRVSNISTSHKFPQNADFIYAPKFETVQEGLDGLRRYLDSITG